MSQTAVLIWVSASSLLPTFHADLESFAQSRLLRLEAPRENATTLHASAYAPDAVAQIEALLEEARQESAALEQSRALTAIEHAEHLLRERPELPQSAWLMAEALELAAVVESDAPDGAEAARALRERRAALEGPRAAAFAGDVQAGPAPAPEHAPLPQVLEIEGLEPGDGLEWDGVEVSAEIRTLPGEHHVRVARNGRLIWAGWAAVGPAKARLRLPVPELLPCSGDDLAAAHFDGGRAVAPPHARCENFVLARSRSGGGIEAALCERATCEPIVSWNPRASVAHAAAQKKPAWPYLLATSAGALAITGVVLWRAGAFDRAAPPSKEVWVWSGQQALGVRF